MNIVSYSFTQNLSEIQAKFFDLLDSREKRIFAIASAALAIFVICLAVWRCGLRGKKVEQLSAKQRAETIPAVVAEVVKSKEPSEKKKDQVALEIKKEKNVQVATEIKKEIKDAVAPVVKKKKIEHMVPLIKKGNKDQLALGDKNEKIAQVAPEIKKEKKDQPEPEIKKENEDEVAPEIKKEINSQKEILSLDVNEIKSEENTKPPSPSPKTEMPVEIKDESANLPIQNSDSEKVQRPSYSSARLEVKLAHQNVEEEPGSQTDIDSSEHSRDPIETSAVLEPGASNPEAVKRRVEQNLSLLKNFFNATSHIKEAPPAKIKPLASLHDKKDLATIEMLLKPLEETGALKVSKKKKILKLEKSNKFSIDAEVIAFLENQRHLFDYLNLGQIQTLIANVNKILSESKFDTKENLRIKKIVLELRQQKIKLWVAEDYQKEKLIPNCRILIQKIRYKISEGQGFSNGANQARLFRHTILQDKIYENMDAWRYNNLIEQSSFSVYDWFGVLSSYLKNFPQEKLDDFENFKYADSVEKTLAEMNALSLQDQTFVGDLMLLLRTAFEEIWLSEERKNGVNKDKSIEEISRKTLGSMLQATPSINRFLCPIMQTSQTGNIMDQKVLEDTVRNTEFLVDVLNLFSFKESI